MYMRKIGAAIAAWCLTLSPLNAEDHCSDVLKDGIFNTVSLNQSVGIQNDYTAWLCTTEFKTHQEAHDAGISLGVVVYGVPLSLGSNFDSSARDTWKRTNCGGSVDRSQYSARYQKLVSEVSDTVVNAWRDCMIGLYQNRIGLNSVALSHGPTLITMKIKWAPYDDFDRRLPKVVGFSMVGATVQTVGNTLFRVGANVPATETNVDFARRSPGDRVILTLNTDRGSVTAYVPPQTMSLRAHVSINPAVEQRQRATKDYQFYQADPDDDCVKDLNFDENYFPPDGYTFTSYTYEETTKNGDRTSYGPNLIANGVHFHMHVQGDDGTFGYCKRHGWLGLNIHVAGERWNPTNMVPFETDVTGPALQETLLVRYPYLIPSADVRNFNMHYTATVQKVIGDDVAAVQLTDGAPNSAGVTSKSDGTGNLIIDASAAFAEWRRQSPSNGPVTNVRPSPRHSLLAMSDLPSGTKPDIETRALMACRDSGEGNVAYSVDVDTEDRTRFKVVCGTDPKRVAGGQGLVLKSVEFTLK